MKFFKKNIPVEFRIIRNALKIYIYRKLNRRSPAVGIKDFPVGLTGEIAFYTYPFFEKDNNQYYAQIYAANKVTDTVIYQHGYQHFISEIMAANMYDKDYNCVLSKESVIPVSIPDKSTDVSNGQLTVTVGDRLIKLGTLKKNSFHYLSLPAKKNIKITSSENNIIVGNPIVKKSHKSGNKKLIISIFIDGLAAETFNRKDFDSLMPRTSGYFSDGLMFFNGYANANWTMPSAPSIFSGLYTINHKIYNSKLIQHVGEGYTILSEYFKKHGYLTCQVDSVMRKGPMFNYVKGFDRTLYKRNMTCKEVVTHAIEHLTAFGKRDNYLWLSFMDIHHDLYGIPDISTQVDMTLSAHDFTCSKSKMPFAVYDKKHTERYVLGAKRLDVYLGLLYDFIKSTYDDNDVVISICSDHGKGYTGEDEERLAEHRIKVPMFFKSSHLDSSVSDEMVEDIDYLPALLKASGFEDDIDFNMIDGRIPYAMGGVSEKKFALSEDIHEDQKYYAAVYGVSYILYVESPEIVNSIDEIDFINYEYRLFDKKSNTVLDVGVCDHPSEQSNDYVAHLKSHKRNMCE
jgi:hypothetical protein